ncbi:unnamed protein product [Dovyalis caffra]|uniref:NAC domain-containing protein n=1 Tax=Dovyalis caffra TaxID=77055 RepID=A0AAV1QT64_9ROSI|nr:unnamed protein product [Dovyalis caffra]
MTSCTTVPLVSNIGDRSIPTTEELVNHCLNHKLLGNDQLVISRIPSNVVDTFSPTTEELKNHCLNHKLCGNDQLVISIIPSNIGDTFSPTTEELQNHCLNHKLLGNDQPVISRIPSNIGDRFSPTPEQLVNHYLNHKLLGNDQLVSRIRQLDIYQFDPWDLPGIDSNDGETYFFSPLHAKNPYTNNGKINRSTRTGSWKGKGKDSKIKHNGEEIGIKKIFVHSCNENEIKYVMHEYSASSNLPNPRALVLCKVMKKKDKKSKGACKKVKMTEEKAEVLPYNMDISTPASDDGSDVEKWIRDQQAENLTCDGGGTNHVPEFTSLEVIDHEILPHLISFPGYDQQYYSLDHFTLDKQSLMLTEQLSTNNGPAGTSVSGPEEDLFLGLEPFYAYKIVKDDKLDNRVFGIHSNDREKYFFSPLHAKNPYTNNGKINRSTKTGSWHATGKDRKITSEHNGEEIGTCKIFVHSCIQDGIKYVMHEYSASSILPNSRALVLCNVMKKKDKKSKGACKKVKMTEERAEVLPYNMDISTPASDDGSDVEKWIRDQQAENLTCDGGGTNHVPEFTSLEVIDHEILPHLISFPGYDQQYYSLDHCTLDKQSLMLTEQLSTNNGPAGTSVFGPEEDLFFGLEPL